LFRAVPDLEIELLDVIAEGEKAVVHWRMTGTFDGEGAVEGIAPTGAAIDMQGIDIVTVRDGLVQHIEAIVNGMEMARQMGAMPPAGSAAEKAMLGAVNARTSIARRLQRRR
jgi:predicted ester cyclase